MVSILFYYRILEYAHILIYWLFNQKDLHQLSGQGPKFEKTWSALCENQPNTEKSSQK